MVIHYNHNTTNILGNKTSVRLSTNIDRKIQAKKLSTVRYLFGNK